MKHKNERNRNKIQILATMPQILNKGNYFKPSPNTWCPTNKVEPWRTQIERNQRPHKNIKDIRMMKEHHKKLRNLDSVAQSISWY